MASQISCSSQLSVYFTNFVVFTNLRVRRKSRQVHSGGPQGRSAQHTVIPLDHGFTNLVPFTFIRALHKSRGLHKSSCTSQISSSSQVFEDFTNLVEAERHLKNNCGRRPRGGPQGRSAQHTVIPLDHGFTILVQFTIIRVLHKSRQVHKYSRTSQISLRRSVI